MAKDSATSLGTLADVIRELYGPGSKYDREALALREPVVRRALEQRMAATKSPAERAREEKKRAEAAAAAEKRAAAPVLTEAEKRMFAGAAGGGKTHASSIWYDEIKPFEVYYPPTGPILSDSSISISPTPHPHPPAWLEGFVDRLTAIDRALAALNDRLDLIDSTVVNIQQEIRRDRS